MNKKSLVIVLVMLLSFSGCGGIRDIFTVEEAIVEDTAGEDLKSGTANDGSDAEKPKDTEGDADEPAETDGQPDTKPVTEGYARSLLTPEQKLWYDDMAGALLRFDGTIRLSEEGIKAGLNEKNVDAIFQSVMNDHPELFYVEGYSYTNFTLGNDTVAVDFTGSYSMAGKEMVERKSQIEAAVEEILKGAPRDADDYVKIKYAYEYLIENTEYDIEALENQNIYSVFVGHYSVCQGYAKAFQYLMHRMGVECALIQGKVIHTGEGHAWNLVKCNDLYYYVDPTWGDISYRIAECGEESTPDGISYDYLNITEEALSHTHMRTEPVTVPPCTATRDNFYVRENAFFDEYNREQFRELVDRMLADGGKCIALRCGNSDCFSDMKKILIEEQEIFEYIPKNLGLSLAYTVDEVQYSMTFFMMTSEE